MNTEHWPEEAIDVFGITLSNQQMLVETDSRAITSIVRERQLQLYGIWHANWKPILLIGLGPKETNQDGGG